MLKKIAVKNYKSLKDVSVELEPFNVFIGPNGSGKSNLCESILVFANIGHGANQADAFMMLSGSHSWKAKHWKGEQNSIKFIYEEKSGNEGVISVGESNTISRPNERKSLLQRGVRLFNFSPTLIARSTETTFQSTGAGIANSLADILFDNRDRFDELEDKFLGLVPNLDRIVLKKNGVKSQLFLSDRSSGYRIPADDVSDGTLRLLGLLVGLYGMHTPDILCFEEPENGVHPWLLHKMVELLKQISVEGIDGQPVQIIITTHSPVLLNYVEPHEIKAFELDEEGATQINSLPTDSKKFELAMEAYDGELGSLWFSNAIGANPA
ncbi:MAG: putative ATPase [Candidatus Promineifilaceae bacterium]|jgi:predicted ATPase